jgi:apolipoprotein N-acyltransferase
MTLAGQRIAVNICYEDLFPEVIRASFLGPTGAPTILLNLSNLAWFDDSRALDQHLQISRMRTLETGRPMLRATNTGATAIIDARGRVVAELPYLTAAALDGEVQGYSGWTPFLRVGSAAAVAAALLVLAVGLLLPRLRRSKTHSPDLGADNGRG